MDEEKYELFYIYYLEIYLPKKMPGFSDQFVVIADTADLSLANFKLKITKKNIADSLRLSPERQYKFMAINIGNMAKYAWTLIKNLVPKKTLYKVNLVGNNPKDIY